MFALVSALTPMTRQASMTSQQPAASAPAAAEAWVCRGLGLGFLLWLNEDGVQGGSPNILESSLAISSRGSCYCYHGDGEDAGGQLCSEGFDLTRPSTWHDPGA